MAFKTFFFDPVHDAALLNAAGYTREHYAASWMDIGGPESGPRLVGGPAFDEWRNGDHFIIVSEGEVVAVDQEPMHDEFPFASSQTSRRRSVSS